MDAVAAVSGAGTGCGGCRELVEGIVRDEQGEPVHPLAQLRRLEPAAPATARDAR